MRKGLIYLLGVVVLGLAYVWMKNALGEPVFFLSAIVYLIALRMFAEKYGNEQKNRQRKQEGQ